MPPLTKSFYFAALCSLLFVPFLSGPSVATGKQGVVIQVSENNPATWNLALNNIKNIQAAMGKDKVNIEIVAFGPGINMLKLESEVGSRLSEARESGVILKACQNTMKAQQLTEADIYPNVGYVASGVIQIISRQREGWSYLRP